MNAIEIVIGIIKDYKGDGGGEGCRLKAYWDSHGQCWTVGWGCTGAGIDEHTVWTQDQADTELRNRLAQCRDQVLKVSPGLAHESDERQAAIIDFVYNLGIGSYKASTLRHNVNDGDWTAAQQSIKLWNKAKDSSGKLIMLPGLVKRRQEESDLMV
jgi:lysozyme